MKRKIKQIIEIALIMIVSVGIITYKNIVPKKISSSQPIKMLEYDNSNLINLDFDKYWEDEGYESYRPNESEFYLYDKQDQNTIIQTITLSESNEDPNDDSHWIGQFTGVPMNYPNGDKVEYVVREKEIPYYHQSYDSETGISIKFNDQTDMGEHLGQNALRLYVTKDNVTYNYRNYDSSSNTLGNELAGETLYLDVYTNEKLYETDLSLEGMQNTSDHGMIEEVIGENYPETQHPYPVGGGQVWHYRFSVSSHTNEFYLVLRADSWGNAFGFKLDDIKTIGNETIVTSTINLKNIEITKKWEDEGYTNKRPSETTYDIYDSRDMNNIIRTVTLDSTDKTNNNTWKKTVENLPKYYNDGQEIEYKIVERPIENYYTLYDYSEYYNGLSITFTEDSDYNFSICYDKTTTETNDGIRNEYTCLGRMSYSYDSTANSKDNDDAGSFIAGHTINIPTHDLYIIYKKNNDVTEEKKIQIQNIEPIHFDNPDRMWYTKTEQEKYIIEENADKNNYLNVRPIELENTYDHVWHYTWTGSQDSKKNATLVRNLINLTNVNFEKQWIDEGYEDERPQEVSFKIYNELDQNTITKEITLTKNNKASNDNYKWNGQFQEVPKYNQDGSLAQYIIKEEPLENYITKYDINDIKGFMISFDNETHIRYSMSLLTLYDNNVFKSNDIYTLKTSSLYNDQAKGKTFFIKCDEGCINSFAIDMDNSEPSSPDENKYGFKITSITPVKEDSNLSSIGYESHFYGYETINDFKGDNYPQTSHPFEAREYFRYTYEPMSNSFTGADKITNAIDFKKVEIIKKWDDIGQETHRPEKILVDIYNENDMETIVKTIELTNADKIDDYTWKKVDKRLKRYDENGKEINYIIKERTQENYTTIYESSKERKGLEVFFGQLKSQDFKICYETENENKALCKKYTMNLYNFSIPVPSDKFYITYDGSKTEKLEITDIKPYYIDRPSNYDLYDKPEDVELTEGTLNDRLVTPETLENKIYMWEYTWKGYLNPTTETDVIKNTVELTSISITKKWEDNGYETSRPEQITLNLYNKNNPETVIRELILTKENKTSTNEWVGIFTGIPKYNQDGTQAKYIIKEEPINSYTTTYKENILTSIENTMINVIQGNETENKDELNVSFIGTNTIINKKDGTIEKTENPKTLDDIKKYVGIFIVSGTILAVSVIFIKKKNKK